MCLKVRKIKNSYLWTKTVFSKALDYEGFHEENLI